MPQTRERRRGTIKRLVSDKGFGFIKSDGDEFFFHKSATVTDFDRLAEGMQVEFTPTLSPKGPRAEAVERG